MKIELKQPILGLDDKPLIHENGKELTVGEALANILITTEVRTATALKLRVLTEKFYRDTETEVELDDADLNLVKEIVKASKAYNTVLVLGYLEKILG